MRWLVIAVAGLIACAGCKKQPDAAPPEAAPVPAMPATEVKRGKDACTSYVVETCGTVLRALMSSSRQWLVWQ